MDWARDNVGLSVKDLENVFKYEDKPTVVARMLAGKEEVCINFTIYLNYANVSWKPVVWSLQGHAEWQNWVCTVRMPKSLSGVVLSIVQNWFFNVLGVSEYRREVIRPGSYVRDSTESTLKWLTLFGSLAKRTGERSSPIVKRINSDNWLAQTDEKTHGNSTIQRASTFAQLGERLNAPEQGLQSMKGKRGVRTLPFSKEVFELIAGNFYIHGSIARAISRADVPVFSHAEIQMKDLAGTSHPAYGTSKSTL
jgi:hypothetical protein